jgi:hypothetical protein
LGKSHALYVGSGGVVAIGSFGGLPMSLRNLMISDDKANIITIDKGHFAIICPCGAVLRDPVDGSSDHFNVTCSQCETTYVVTKLKLASCSIK